MSLNAKLRLLKACLFFEIANHNLPHLLLKEYLRLKNIIASWKSRLWKSLNENFPDVYFFQQQKGRIVFYHMTRTAPRATSLENQFDPYEGRTRRSDRVWKARTAWIEMCTAPQNRYELITETILLLQNFVFSKISDENEHSNSEFYGGGGGVRGEEYIVLL